MAAGVVHLNVGGVAYCAAASTLKCRDGVLARLAADARSAVRDGEGRVFIDRNGALFRFVLDFLRDAEINPPRGFADWGALRREFSYFFGSGFDGFDFVEGDDAPAPAAPAPAPVVSAPAPIVPAPAPAPTSAPAAATFQRPMSPARPAASAVPAPSEPSELRRLLTEVQSRVDRLQEMDTAPPPGATSPARQRRPEARFEAEGVTVVMVPADGRVVFTVGGTEVGRATALTYSSSTKWLTTESGQGYPFSRSQLRAVAGDMLRVAAAAGVPLAGVEDADAVFDTAPRGSPRHRRRHDGSTAELLRWIRKEVHRRSGRGADLFGVLFEYSSHRAGGAPGVEWAAWPGHADDVRRSEVVESLLRDGFDIVAPGFVALGQDGSTYACSRPRDGVVSLRPTSAVPPLAAGFAVAWAPAAVTVQRGQSGVSASFTNAALRRLCCSRP
eukprot:TRINITY_DN8641_c0_g1_i1.p1 TRINITY_DN8641_c0_g1~~TRINITY_DN8641_c0_g1_i1.p1  ORF type:complete len:460 (+),score=109.81 TRINITY_DN8641_c0_g1_i1:52-1380(+)